MKRVLYAWNDLSEPCNVHSEPLTDRSEPFKDHSEPLNDRSEPSPFQYEPHRVASTLGIVGCEPRINRSEL